MSSSFIYQDSGKCDIPITTPDECRNAARQLGRYFGSERGADYASGCYLDGNSVYLNHNPKSDHKCGHTGSQCICKLKTGCQPCPFNTYNKDPGPNTKCEPCKGNTPTTNFRTGQTECVAVSHKVCEGGKEVDDGDGIKSQKKCVECEKNHYSN